MSRASATQRRRATGVAAITVVFIALFAGAFIGLVGMLNDYADSLQPEEEIEIAATAPADPFYVLLIGSDSRRGTALYTGKATDHAQLDQYSDIMTLMRVDPRTYTITLVSVPRDTVLDGQQDKINASLRDNDPEAVVAAVGKLTGITADYYMMVTFISFENLVNAVGGIDIDVPFTIEVSDPATGKRVTVKAGKNQHLDGSAALALARARKEYGSEQDALRQVNVRNIERTLIQKMLDSDGDFDAEHVLAILEDDTKTDLDLPSAGLLMLSFVEHASEVTFYEGTGPYEDELRESDGSWVIEQDAATWARVMAVVDAGGDPSSVLKPPEF